MVSKVSNGTVRVAPARAIVKLLQEAGVDANEVLGSVGIEPELFGDPDSIISFDSRVRLLEACREKTRCEHFGLLVGQHDSLSAFGLVGYVSKNSSTVEEALASFCRHLHLYVHGADAYLNREGNSAFLGYGIHQALPDGAYQLEDAAVASAYTILGELCGRDWKANEIWFTHQSPRDISPYRQIFQTQLRFDMEQSGVLFNQKLLRREVDGVDPELNRLLQKQIDELEHSYREDFSEQVRRVMKNALLTKRYSVEEVSSTFHMHSRTFHRRLKAEGTTYQELVDKTRYDISRQMLENPDTPLSQITEVLGYADTRALNRAFKRWSGSTPAQWRKASRAS